MYLKIIHLDSIDSTNDRASALAAVGAKEVTVVSARSQVKGKGRRGRLWQSPADQGVYLSLILRPANPVKEIYYLPLVFAVAVAHALEHRLKVNVKLPNDIMVENRKLGEILVEAKTTGRSVDFVVAGIGINVNTSPEALPAHATSLSIETKISHPVREVSREVIRESLKFYRRFKQGDIDFFLKAVTRYHEVKSSQLIEKEYLRNKEAREVICIR